MAGLRDRGAAAFFFVALVCIAHALPAPPASGPQFENIPADTTLAALLSVRREKASHFRPKPTPVALKAPNMQKAISSNTGGPTVIQSAKLLSHIVSENSQPFQPANTFQSARNIMAPKPFTIPNIDNARQRSPDYNDDDFVLLELLQPTIDEIPSQTTVHNIDPAVQAPTFNQVTNQRENFLVTLDNTPNLNFRTTPNVLQSNNRIVLNNLRPQFLQNVGIPLPTLNNVDFGGINNQVRQSVQPLQRPTISDSRFVNNQVGIPLPSLSSQGPNIGGTNNALTVGDLVMSLNGRNGIRVLSLGDLTNGGFNSFQSNDGTNDLLQQIRNAMISGNIDNVPTQQINSLVGLDVGSPISSVVQQNIDNMATRVTEDEINQGRQFEFGFDSNGQNAVNNDGGVINDLLFDATISTQDIDASSGSVIDDLFSSSNIGAGDFGSAIPLSVDQDPFPDTFDSDIESDLYSDPPLEENTDFEFEYDDSLPPLPPQPPNVFRRGLSDIFFTKGQWIGTLLGGLFDVSSAIGSSVSKIFNKSSERK